jgi:hypothetical protein
MYVMKNLVYLCLFLNENYIRFLELFFGSVALFSKNSLETTDFLVITQQEFVPQIQAIGETFGISIRFWIQEKPISIFISTVLRYEIFRWSEIANYSKLLYLDTDILINGELNTVFNLLEKPDKLYTFREGPISHIYWGGDEIFDFEGEDKEIDKDTIGFCSGVLLFQANTRIASLFEMGKDYMLKKLQVPGSMIPICYDQPYMNYICVKYNLNENDSLGTCCVNRAFETVDGYVIYHFPATMFTNKYTNMITILMEMLKPIESSTQKDALLTFMKTGEVFLQEYDELQDKHKKF